MMRLMDAAAGIQRLGPGQPAVLQSARAVPVSELLGRLQVSRVAGCHTRTLCWRPCIAVQQGGRQATQAGSLTPGHKQRQSPEF